MNYKIKIINASHYTAVVNLLPVKGWRWLPSPAQTPPNYLFLDGRTLKILHWSNDHSAFENDKGWEVTFDALCRILDEDKIKIGGDPVLFIEDGSISVGCEFIKFETIEAIYKKALETKKIWI